MMRINSMAHNLKNLSKMETLNITGQIDLPAEMGSTLSTMSSLKALTLAHCTMEQDVAKGIGQCQLLEKMDLRNSKPDEHTKVSLPDYFSLSENPCSFRVPI